MPIHHGSNAPPRLAQANTQPPFRIASILGEANAINNGKTGANAKPHKPAPTATNADSPYRSGINPSSAKKSEPTYSPFSDNHRRMTGVDSRPLRRAAQKQP